MPSSSPRFEHLANRAVQRGLEGQPVTRQMQQLCRDIVEAGVPVRRANLSITTLHPRYGAHSFVWHADGDSVVHLPRTRGIWGEEIFRRSPVFHLRQTGETSLRVRIAGAGPLPFPVLHDLRDEGMTDYFGRLVSYTLLADAEHEDAPQLDGLYFSGATDVEAGFRDGDLRALSELLVPFALAVKSRAVFDVAEALLETYLGADAGHRVLTGAIDKGSVETIRAVIWLCDLGGFTALAGEVPLLELVRTLDDYLDVMAEPVLTHGGEILKFLGDGFIATFPLDHRPAAEVCRDVIAAAQELCEGVDLFNRGRAGAGAATLPVRLAVHIGEVLYGNIGALDRLDFTMIGPAINEASRMEAVCKTIEAGVLFSEAFHEASGRDGRLMPAGRFSMRGVPGERTMFTLEPIGGDPTAWSTRVGPQ